jgi:hypothetical protein
MEVKTDGKNVFITLEMSTPALADEMQRTLDYARILELTKNMNKVSQEEVDKLSDEIKRDWWDANKSRFIK